METLIYIFSEYIMHFDKYIPMVMENYGYWVYFILFAIIFCETGLVVTPFLPGDSLLFACGALAATSSELHFGTLFIICLAAAISGDSCNYWIGEEFGHKLLSKTTLIKPEHIKKTEDFYNKHGHKAIFLCRFAPIVRTFAPFVAGIGSMHYRTFVMWNIIGAIAWVSLFTGAGYFFGNVPFVKNNFHYVALGIIIVSVIPIFTEIIKAQQKDDATEK